VTSGFFAFTVPFASNPLSEFCYIHLNFTAVGRHHEVYLKITLIVTNCTVIVLILSDSVQYCAVRSALNRVQVDVPLAVIFLWLHGQFSRSKRK